jgi:hypothetical protein
MWSSDEDDINVRTTIKPKGRKKVIQSSDDSYTSKENNIDRNNDDIGVIAKKFPNERKMIHISDDDSADDRKLFDHDEASSHSNRNILSNQENSKRKILSKKVQKTIYDSSDDVDSDSSFESKLKSLHISRAPRDYQALNYSQVPSSFKKDSQNSIKTKKNNIESFVDDQNVDSDLDSIISDESSIARKNELEKTQDYSILDHNIGNWTLDSSKHEYCLQSNNSTSSAGLPKVQIPLAIFKNLFDYQIDGVEFLAKLHGQRVGGILADDMGKILLEKHVIFR